MNAPISRATTTVAQHAAGAIEAQRVVDGLRDGTLNPDVGWLRLVELTSRFGRNSPAVRAFVLEVLKRLV